MVNVVQERPLTLRQELSQDFSWLASPPLYGLQYRSLWSLRFLKALVSIFFKSKYFQFQPIFKNMNKISAHQFFFWLRWDDIYQTFWDLVTFTYLIPTYLPSVKIIWPDIYTVSLFAQPASFHTELKDIQSRTKTTQSQYYAFKWHTTMTLPPYFDINTKDTLKRPPDIKDFSICHVS